jgi:hypothetical protein
MGEMYKKMVQPLILMLIMKKLLMLIFLLLSSSLRTYAQDNSSKTELLTQKKWRIKTHTMTGLGVHNSLPKDAVLQFDNNGTWTCSHPFVDAYKGKWSFENNAIIIKVEGEEKDRNLKINELSKNLLSFKLKKGTSVEVFEWEIDEKL